MDSQRKQQVSLRGSSAKEMSRDALLEKVAKERELRSYNRMVAVSALFIERVWRRYNMIRKVATELRDQWDIQVSQDVDLRSRAWVSNTLLRPFLFFITYSSTLYKKPQIMDEKSMLKCFEILLKSINSTDSELNFCALALGTSEEKATWYYQSRKLISICSTVLSKWDYTPKQCKDTNLLTTISMRLMIALTDIKVWKNIHGIDASDGAIATRTLVGYVSNKRSGLYCCIRCHIMKLPPSMKKQYTKTVQTDNPFMVIASAITLALRPFQVYRPELDVSSLLLHQLNTNEKFLLQIKEAAVQFCVFLLTIPWLKERIPGVLLPALKHFSVLFPCLKVLLISKDDIFTQMTNLDKKEVPDSGHVMIPSPAWALGNIMSLVTEDDTELNGPGRFMEGLDYEAYLRAVCCISVFLLPCLRMIRDVKKVEKDSIFVETSPEEIQSTVLKKDSFEHLCVSFIDLMRPAQQQWHLMRLLTSIKKSDVTIQENASAAQSSYHSSSKLELLDIVYFYSDMLRIYSLLNVVNGSLPILNVLAFTPGFLLDLWQELETFLMFCDSNVSLPDKPLDGIREHTNPVTGSLEDIERRSVKDSGNKWVNVLRKFAAKTIYDMDSNNLGGGSLGFEISGFDSEQYTDKWDVKSLRRGPQGIPKGSFFY